MARRRMSRRVASARAPRTRSMTGVGSGITCIGTTIRLYDEPVKALRIVVRLNPALAGAGSGGPLPSRADDQHRRVGVLDHVAGDAAEQQPIHAVQAARAGH